MRTRVSFKRSFAVFLAAVLMLIWSVSTVFSLRADAATFNDINKAEVFVKQSESKTCTLASMTMMLRRGAMLSGDRDWQKITESTVRPYAWIEGVGVRWNFTYNGMNVSNESLTGNHKDKLIKLLKEHPEGIVAYSYASDYSYQHAVLLTDYTDGVFYCADPARYIENGRIPLSKAHVVNVDNIVDYWYIASPNFTLEKPTEATTVPTVPEPELPTQVPSEEPSESTEPTFDSGAYREKLLLKTGENAEIVRDGSASEKIVEWTTSNPKIAEVSPSGVVTAESNGLAVVVGTAENGEKISCTVMVLAGGQKLGDVDENNEVDSVDAALVLQDYVGIITDDGGFNRLSADVDFDLEVGSADATMILQLYSGIIDAFVTD